MLLTVRRLRLEQGLTLEEASRVAKVGPQSLARIETGRELPWPALRRRLSDLYGVTAEELFADIDQAQEHLRRIAGRTTPLTDGLNR